jgi:hypothetical protein
VVLSDQLLIHQMDGGCIDIHNAKIEQWDAKLIAGRIGDFLAAQEFVLDEIADKRLPLFKRLLVGTNGIAFGQQAIADKSPGQSRQLDSWISGRHGFPS